MPLQARLAGFDVRVERSWFASLLLMTLLFSGSGLVLLPHELTVVPALALGLGVALALTASLLLHELAHARVSQRAGIEIDYLCIFAAGAACHRREQFRRPRHQFRVAAAGPLVSALLGIAVLGCAAFVQAAGWPASIAIALWFVAFANMLVAVSNLLPVFPFDGGKVIHAMFWRRLGDRSAATARLRRTGREFSRMTIALGLILLGWGGEILLGLAIGGFGFYLLYLPPPQ